MVNKDICSNCIDAQFHMGYDKWVCLKKMALTNTDLFWISEHGEPPRNCTKLFEQSVSAKTKRRHASK